jgi:ABC-type transporter Mla maintaining outer membrane lipid asymmetry ATPase subunit MlaF
MSERPPIISVRGLTNRFGEAVIHEDLDLDVRGALAAGFRAMLFDPTGQRAPGGITVLRRLRELPSSL